MGILYYFVLGICGFYPHLGESGGLTVYSHVGGFYCHVGKSRWFLLSYSVFFCLWPFFLLAAGWKRAGFISIRVEVGGFYSYVSRCGWILLLFGWKWVVFATM